MFLANDFCLAIENGSGGKGVLVFCILSYCIVFWGIVDSNPSVLCTVGGLIFW